MDTWLVMEYDTDTSESHWYVRLIWSKWLGKTENHVHCYTGNVQSYVEMWWVHVTDYGNNVYS